MISLPWYENYKQGRRIGSVLAIGGVAVAIYSALVGKHPVPGVACSIVSTIGGLYLLTKSYMKDPDYRSEIIQDFRLNTLRVNVQNYGWNVILELISIDELKTKVLNDIGDHPTLDRIFDVLGSEIAQNCVRYELLRQDQMHHLFLEKLYQVGFDRMCQRYGRWWLDDGIISVEELQPHFKNYLNSIQDIIYFFKNYMIWPYERYRVRLQIEPSKETFLIQLYNTYTTASKSYRERKSQIQKEYTNSVYSYSGELAILSVETNPDSKTRRRIQELQTTISLQENKRNENNTVLKANWREIKRLIRTNWLNYLSGAPQQHINTSFASSTQVLPVQSQQPTIINVVQNQTHIPVSVPMPSPSAPPYI